MLENFLLVGTSSVIICHYETLGLHEDLHQVTYHLIVLHGQCNWAMVGHVGGE